MTKKNDKLMAVLTVAALGAASTLAGAARADTAALAATAQARDSAPGPGARRAPAPGAATSGAAAPAAATPGAPGAPAAPPGGTQPRGLIFSAPRPPLPPGESFSLRRLLDIARAEGPVLAAARASALAARAGVQSATVYPNPQVEFLAGDVRARRAAGLSGSGTELGLAQRIENPALRRARISAAEAGASSAEAAIGATEANVVAEIRQRFFEVLRAQEELQAARDDAALTEQILERIRVRVRTGESARFDLVRAETEVAVARRNVATAQLRIEQSKALLRQTVAPTLPAEFNVEGEAQAALEGESVETLRRAVLESNPLLRVALAEAERAERQVGVERGLVLPGVDVRLLQTTAPDVTTYQAGVLLNVPVFDQRRGPILAAQQLASRARLEADRQRFELAQSFEAALSAYQASLAQLRALEGGIIAGARNSLEIAEAAYRFGERGILEFLDAQRTFRLVRNDLIAARYGLQAARIELERLAGLGVEGR